VRRALAIVLALSVCAAPAAVARTVRPDPHSKCHATAKRKRAKSCHATTRSPVTMTPANPTAAPPWPAAPPAPGPRSRLGVSAREFSLVLSRTSVPSGAALVQLQNFGEDAHNLRIERVDGTGTALDLPEAQAGEVTSAAATLAPGAYRLYCTLPGHDALGMHATLTVGG
jgi:plastocyanin